MDLNCKKKEILYLLVVYARLIQSSSIKIKHGVFDVDDFLKKIITSEKFNEITEKIADKAVEKFQKLQENKMTPPPSSFNKEVAYRVSELGSLKQMNTSGEQVKNKEDTNKTTHTRSKTIDIKAFMRQESNSLNDLSLKFKHFTKSTSTPNSRELVDDELFTDVKKTTPTKLSAKSKEDKTSPVTKAKEKKNDYDETTNTHSWDASEERVTKLMKAGHKVKLKLGNEQNSNSMDSDESFDANNNKRTTENEASENAKSKKYKLNKKMEKFEGTELIDSKVVDSDSSNRHKRKQKSNKRTTESEPSEKEKEIESDITKENQEMKKHESNELIGSEDPEEPGSSDMDKRKQKKTLSLKYKSYKIRKPAYEYYQLPTTINKNETNDILLKFSSEQNIPKTDYEKQEPEKQSNKTPNSEESPKLLKKSEPITIRKEGNKLYTFEDNPDYEDYRQEISRIQNQLKNA